MFTGSAALDSRHSLYSDFDSGPDLLLFNEGDISGVYTHEVYLSSFFFAARTMSAAEILALGGPKAHGILAPAIPIKASIDLQTTNLLLSWSGGEGPYQIQTSDTSTNFYWQNIGLPTNTTNTLVPRTNYEGYLGVTGSAAQFFWVPTKIGLEPGRGFV